MVIADGRCGLRLIRAGEPNELGCPTLIDVQAGPFAGSVRDDTVGPYAAFRDQLTALYNGLSGTARLASAEGFSLVLTGDGRGGVSVSVAVTADHVAPIRLVFGFDIDQTYLPGIIRQLNATFPAT